MGGLTLGIIATSCFFIFVNPFQKKAPVQDIGIVENGIDSFKLMDTIARKDTTISALPTAKKNNGSINRDSLVLFAKTLLGTPYLYGSTDPLKGFDCSGFITYVFNHFSMKVPRSSYEFANVGKKIALNTCKPGDVILFTGTNQLERTIGHIGIVCEVVNGYASFIHSSSGKANGVTITSMDNKFYQERFMAAIDLLSLD